MNVLARFKDADKTAEVSSSVFPAVSGVGSTAAATTAIGTAASDSGVWVPGINPLDAVVGGEEMEGAAIGSVQDNPDLDDEVSSAAGNSAGSGTGALGSILYAEEFAFEDRPESSGGDARYLRSPARSSDIVLVASAPTTNSTSSEAA